MSKETWPGNALTKQGWQGANNWVSSIGKELPLHVPCNAPSNFTFAKHRLGEVYLLSKVGEELPTGGLNWRGATYCQGAWVLTEKDDCVKKCGQAT